MTTKRKPGRPKTTTERRQLVLYVLPEMIDDLDKLVARREQQRGSRVSRVDLVREAIRQYIDREMVEEK